MNQASEKIIIVDDEERMCQSLSALLNDEGYSVDTFTDPGKAIDSIKSNKVDLVISDIKMPSFTGLDILKTVKSVDADIPVILLTGYASLDTAVDAISNGAYDYLMKPVEFTQLNIAVRRALEKRHSDLARLSLLEELKISNLILHRRISELNALYEAGKSIGSTANLKELLRQIVALASNVTDAQVGSIMLLDDRGKYMTIEAAIGLEDKVIESTKLPLGESIAGYVAETGEPLIIDNVEEHDKFKRKSKDRYSSKSLLCAPLKIKNKVIGVINMANKDNNEKFNKNDLRLLTTFASQAAIAVDDANLFARKQRRLIEFEILHEITNEMPNVKALADFRNILLEKLERVFKIDYTLWLEYDLENQWFIINSASGIADIPQTASGKIDLSKITIEELVLNPVFDSSADLHDIEYVTKSISDKMSENSFLPNPTDASIAVPIFRLGELAFVMFIGNHSDASYSEEDIALAKIVISQSAIMFEKENALLNATRLLTMGNMISEISHDLRRPLTTIKGGLQVIRDKMQNELSNSELFQTVEDEVVRMNELVRELVDFSNPKKYQMEKVNLKSIVQKASELVEPDLQKKHISFSSEFEDLDWEVIVNKNQILEIFLNLYINAIDAMGENGKLIVKGIKEMPHHKKVEYLAVKISDTGEGIKKENLSKIFDRYFTTKSTGTGLGLAVVERVISAHGGTLSVDSDYGKGTTFTMYFPLEA
ncbi:MAG: response regulator [Calditrichaeota bacterium]|nr:MAG: response regulator [Calditrichota bacterium]